MSINKLSQKCHEEAKALGWYDPGHTKSDTEALMLVVSEVAELVECLREPSYSGMEKYTIDESGKPVGPATELADAVIRLLDLAAYHNVDLDSIIDLKLKYNRTRGHKHGKRF